MLSPLQSALILFFSTLFPYNPCSFLSKLTESLADAPKVKSDRLRMTDE